VNVFLNYVLIFGLFGLPALGVCGAALATVISRIVECLVVVYFVLKIDRRLKVKIQDFKRWDYPIFRDLVKYGTPLMLGQLVWAFNNVLQSRVIGQLPRSAITAASVSGMLDRLLWMGTWGIAAATGIMVGKAIGGGEFAKVRQYAKTMQAVFLGIGVFSCLLIYFGHKLFLKFYNLSPESYQMTEKFMLVLAVIIIGRCYQAPALFGLVKSGGDTAFVFKNDTFWVFCWILPLSLLGLHLNWEPWLIFGILLSDQIMKCFVALVKINRFNWMKNLTRN
ncbi:MAG: MATE family efflux transporter, partial [Victivallaceae bacterium]